MKKICFFIIFILLALSLASCKSGEEAPASYTVTLEVNGGVALSPITVSPGEKLILPTPIREGYDFLQWCVDKELLTTATDKYLATISSDITLYASWIVKVPDPVYVTVTFIMDGDLTETRSLLVGNDLRDIPSPVEKEDYSVIWDRTEFKSITSDITVNPIYTPFFSDDLYIYHPIVGGTYSIQAKPDSFRTDETIRLTLPESYNGKSITAISNNAFLSCSSLSEVIVPEDYTNIGKSAFSDCYKLTSISFLGKPVFAEGALNNVINLASLSIDLNNQTLPFIFGREQYWHSNKTEINGIEYWVPDLLTTIEYTGLSIPNSAFRGCIKLVSVTINNPLFSGMGEYAFYGCSSLEEVYVPIDSEMTEISDFAFARCSALTTIRNLSSVTKIGESSFEFCQNLVSLATTAPLTAIGRHAFYSCTVLSIINKSSTCVVGTDAFLGTNIS